MLEKSMFGGQRLTLAPERGAVVTCSNRLIRIGPTSLALVTDLNDLRGENPRSTSVFLVLGT